MSDAEKINYLWTHRTQDHAWLDDEELLVDRAEGVWLWTARGRKLMDSFAGLAVVNVGHGRREIAEAIAEQTVRLAYYPTTRQFSNRPAAELAEKLAALTPGDLTYTMFAVSGSEANERSMQIARHYWLARGQRDKYKIISLQGAYHGATMGTLAVCGLPTWRSPTRRCSCRASPRSSRPTRSAIAEKAPTRSWSRGARLASARRSSARARRRSPR